jgi:hypothetical protein
VLLAKKQGGTTVRGHTWEHDHHAVDVPYELAMELLAIKGGGFYVPEPEEITEPAPAAELSESPKPRAKGKQDAAVAEEKAAVPAAAPPAAKPAAGK